MSASSVMMTNPAIALRSPRSRRRRRNPDDCCRDDKSVESATVDIPETSLVASTASIALAIANSRVDEGVNDVHDQVGQDEDDRDQEDDALHDRVVTVEDRANENATDAANRKDRLDDHGAAQQECQ